MITVIFAEEFLTPCQFGFKEAKFFSNFVKISNCEGTPYCAPREQCSLLQQHTCTDSCHVCTSRPCLGEVGGMGDKKTLDMG